jgi:hypothetical protein
LNLKKTVPFFLATLALVVISLFFFRSQLANKKISAPDEINYIAASSEVRQHAAKKNTHSFWTNSMFSGMPTYQIEKLPLGWTPFDFLRKAVGLFMNPMLSFFIAMSLLCFISLLLLGIPPWLACIGAFAYTYTSGHFVIAATGHYTKLDSLVYLPMILAGFHLIFYQRRIIGFILFTTGLLFNIQANHIQMTYYIFIVLAIYGLVELIKNSKASTIKSYVLSIVFVMAAVLLAILGNIAHLYTMKDYAEETVRGKSILSVSHTTQPVPKAGLDWNYASEFSNGYLDLMSMIIPGFVGGSSKEKTSTSSDLAEDFRRKSKKVSVPFFTPLYWGSLPFSSGPTYVGIISFILCCLGMVYIKSNIKYWAAISFSVLLLMSLGHHFFLNKFLFDYLPYYNKFRSPDSILLVAAPLVPWFGIYTLNELLKGKWKEFELKRFLKKASLPILIFMASMAFIGLFIFDFSHESDKSFWSNVQAMVDTRKMYTIKDTIRAIVLAIVFLSGLYYTLINKLNRNYFFIGLAFLMMMDLLPIARRCLPEQSYVESKVVNDNLSKTEGNEEILKDKNLHYRVMDQANNTFNDAFASLYHSSIGGYHPAKLRRYQDLIDGYLAKNHQGCINMLNAKYIITKDGQITVNPGAEGNAWFADTVISALTPDEEFATLKNIDTRHQAVILENEFPGYRGASFVPNGNISLIEYQPDQLTYKYSTATPQLVVFSEIWYGPDKGWHAYIDGKEEEHIRVNYVLRALKVPPGSHTIEFKFYPDKVWTAIRWNRIILWILLILFTAGIAYTILHPYSMLKKTSV